MHLVASLGDEKHFIVTGTPKIHENSKNLPKKRRISGKRNSSKDDL
jgi:hypothetical protein